MIAHSDSYSHGETLKLTAVDLFAGCGGVSQGTDKDHQTALESLAASLEGLDDSNQQRRNA